MKHPLYEQQARFMIPAEDWRWEHWSRDDQINALCEGLQLKFLTTNEIASDVGNSQFQSNEEAIEYVKQRAAEGSDLHKRAVVLHVGWVLTQEERPFA